MSSFCRRGRRRLKDAIRDCLYVTGVCVFLVYDGGMTLECWMDLLWGWRSSMKNS